MFILFLPSSAGGILENASGALPLWKSSLGASSAPKSGACRTMKTEGVVTLLRHYNPNPATRDYS
eukprot:scaffold143108_cov32-Tisochrysis_lutea.AAC.1